MAINDRKRFRFRKFPSLRGNRGRWIQQHCPNYSRKLGNWRFCTCAIEMWPKSTKNVVKLWTFRNFYRKSTSLRMTMTTEFGPELQVMAFMRMRKKKWRKMFVNAFRSSKFLTLFRSLIAESNGIVRIVAKNSGKLPFLRMHNKIWQKETTKLCQITKILVLIIGNRRHWKQQWQQISDRNEKLCHFRACAKKKSQRSWSSKYSTSTNGTKKYKIAEIVQTSCKQPM